MSKICLITLFVLFTVSAITARSTEFKGVESSLETISKNNQKCPIETKHGDPCLSDSECCNNSSKMVCNMYAKRCQVEITAEDLQKGRANLKHVNINQ
ncbi:hypothetical protein HCN44_010737 [Aphidius gifuensis]|uniref:Uncharacterized protein n=1 Tax=Aphidius gifuensis TaxID=684658 RepID=A0A834XW72_APHGI|nr:hypothetical protein HCN44_010737 [Aphidius gifuensis]